MRDQRIEVETADGEVLRLPTKYEVCPTCGGRGTHVNRAIDGNGLTREDFAEDPDFAESYFAGHYDVRCETCHGERVVAVVDVERLTEREREVHEAHQKAAAECRRDDDSERRYFARFER